MRKRCLFLYAKLVKHYFVKLETQEGLEPCVVKACVACHVQAQISC